MTHLDASTEVRTFLIECFVDGAQRAQVEAADARARVVVEGLRGQGHAVDYFGAVFVPGDETAFYLFGACDIAAVVEAGERAALPASRVVESIVIGDRTWPGGELVGP